MRVYSCKASDPSSEGCEPVSGGIPVTNIKLVIDTDREVEKIHSLFLQNMEKLEAMQGIPTFKNLYILRFFKISLYIYNL